VIQHHVQLLTEELGRLEKNQFPPAPEWVKPQENHPYDRDLNVSEGLGLFAFLSRCQTLSGQKILHGWLLNPCLPDEARLRQAAIVELREQKKFREAYLATERSLGGKLGGTSIGEAKENVVNSGPRVAVQVVVGIQGMAFLLLTGGFIWGRLWPVFGLFLVQICINAMTLTKQMRVITKFQGLWREIRIFRALLIELEKYSFSSARLKSMHEDIFVQGTSPSKAMKKLERYLQCLDLRGSAIHPLVNNLFLWDLFWIMRLLSWMRTYEKKLELWISTCGEMESLCSLATTWFNHPHWAMPGYASEPLLIDVSNLGHPLLAREKQVVNDFFIPGPHHICFVTGPNMAGKSTYLRSVATAVIMAQAGMPVCATRMRLGPLRLITSLSHTDSLREGKSLFHKELDRLVMMWDRCRDKAQPVFFLIDEMLRGTNPIDRFVGSQWALKLLSREPAGGIVATHDLRLVYFRDVENPSLTIQNHHFSCRIEPYFCHFDYKLYSGVAPSVNALALMRQRGLPIPDVEPGQPAV
jgi:hypothetical protein